MMGGRALTYITESMSLSLLPINITVDWYYCRHCRGIGFWQPYNGCWTGCYCCIHWAPSRHHTHETLAQALIACCDINFPDRSFHYIHCCCRNGWMKKTLPGHYCFRSLLDYYNPDEIYWWKRIHYYYILFMPWRHLREGLLDGKYYFHAARLIELFIFRAVYIILDSEGENTNGFHFLLPSFSSDHIVYIISLSGASSVQETSWS